MGLYQSNGLTDVFTCKLLEGISKENKKAKSKQTKTCSAGRNYKIYRGLSFQLAVDPH